MTEYWTEGTVIIVNTNKDEFIIDLPATEWVYNELGGLGYQGMVLYLNKRDDKKAKQLFIDYVENYLKDLRNAEITKQVEGPKNAY